MLRNYFKIAFRNLTRNLVFSVINMAGLSIGIATSLLIMLWVADEISYDRFHKNIDNLYQVRMNANVGDELDTWSDVPLIAYEELKAWPAQFRNVPLSRGRLQQYLRA